MSVLRADEMGTFIDLHILIDVMSVTDKLMFAFSFFFLNDPPPPDISPLPLHDPFPISHPHGGLIRGMAKWLVAPANDGFVRGEYEVGAMKLFVSAGAGLWAGFAVRLGVPASIDLL